jgi:MFS family permease
VTGSTPRHTGPLGRSRAALASRDFRFLLGARLISQLADGVFQAYLIDKLVFLSPENQSTAAGVARAFAVLVIPFSLVGPLTGVVIDRWSRRRILAVTPVLRTAAAAALIAVSGGEGGVPLYALALVVVSLNRFYLATAGAVMPSLVPDEDLLVGNSMASAMGTVVTFIGLVAGTQLADTIHPGGLLAVTVVCWPAAAILAALIGKRLQATGRGAAFAAELRRLASELWRGARRLTATPVAVGSITSVAIDQLLVGIITVLGVVVFKEEFKQGVASYGRILGAGGVGVLVGTVTVGLLEERLAKPRIMAVAFAIAGAVCLAGATRITGFTILLVSFTLGLTYTWRKIPADTLVQEAIPDRFRGRVFALYDLAFSLPRVIAAALAVLLIPHLSAGWIVAACGAVYLAWAPLVPAWTGRPRWVGLRFYAGGRPDEVPRSLVVAGDEEPVVQVLGSWNERRDGVPARRFRLRTADEVLDVVRPDGEDRWRVERQASL